MPLMLIGVALSEWIGARLPECFFYEGTGLWCPGCGATRSAMSLREGEVEEALRNNVVFAAGVTLGILWLLLAGMRVRFPEVSFLRVFRFRLWFLWVVLGVLVGFWVIRNLPGFEWLGPGGGLDR